MTQAECGAHAAASTASDGRRARRSLGTIAAIIGAVALAVTLVAAGFGVCAGLPMTTELLSRAASGNDTTPFSTDELVRAALATRDYTIGSNDRNALALVIAEINQSAETPYAELGADRIWEAPERYTLTSEALSHLDDVHEVVFLAAPALAAIALVALGLLSVAATQRGRRAAGAAFVAAGAFVICLFLACGLWAALDFSGFFAAFHALFFAAGSWTFPADSLLITMYPAAFWMGMGIVWLAVSALASILAIAIGRALWKAGRETKQA